MTSMRAPVLKTRRLTQYSLRTLLVGTLVIAFSVNIVARRAAIERQAANSVVRLGGTVSYDWQFDEDFNPSGNQAPPGPEWLRRMTGDEYFQSIVSVAIVGRPCGDADLPPLHSLPKLKEVLLANTQVSDRTARVLAGAKNLEILDVSFTRISDRGITQLSSLPRLRRLFAGTISNDPTEKVTDECVRDLARVPHLEVLQITGRGITNASAVPLRRMTSLKELMLCSTSMSEEAIAHLKASLPKCAIYAAEF